MGGMIIDMLDTVFQNSIYTFIRYSVESRVTNRETDRVREKKGTVNMLVNICKIVNIMFQASLHVYA